jgi:hypothetical protein
MDIFIGLSGLERAANLHGAAIYRGMIAKSMYFPAS